MFSTLVRNGLQQHISPPFTTRLETILRTKPTGIFITINEGKPAFNPTDCKVPAEENLLVSITN